MQFCLLGRLLHLRPPLLLLSKWGRVGIYIHTHERLRVCPRSHSDAMGEIFVWAEKLSFVWQSGLDSIGREEIKTE